MSHMFTKRMLTLVQEAYDWMRWTAVVVVRRVMVVVVEVAVLELGSVG